MLQTIILVLCQVINDGYIGRGNPAPTNTSIRHLSVDRALVLCQVINDGYIGRGNPAPTNTSIRHLSVDRALVSGSGESCLATILGNLRMKPKTTEARQQLPPSE